MSRQARFKASNVNSTSTLCAIERYGGDPMVSPTKAQSKRTLRTKASRRHYDRTIPSSRRNSANFICKANAGMVSNAHTRTTKRSCGHTWTISLTPSAPAASAAIDPAPTSVYQISRGPSWRYLPIPARESFLDPT
jgi:hypothetical protein